MTGRAEVLTVDLDSGETLAVEVRGIPRADLALLVDEYPPRPGDPGPWNEATFPAALISACTDLDLRSAAVLAEDTDLGDDVTATCLRLSQPGALQWARDRIATDPRLAAELAYCAPRGIPHSMFLSWPGRDQDLAITWAEAQADRCPGCGVPSSDMTDPGAWRPRVRPCLHCESTAQARDSIPPEHQSRVQIDLIPGDRGGGEG